MKEHLKTTTTLLFIVALATGIYFTPIITLVVVTLLFLYTAIYAGIKESEEKSKENGGKTEENN
jgi:hypothetical protein